MTRGNHRTIFRHMRAPALALALLAALLLALPGVQPHEAQAQAAEVVVWSATLTVSDLVSGGWMGCHNGNTPTKDKCTTAATLSDDDFTYDSVTYDITSLFVRSTGSGKGSLSFRINNHLTFEGEKLALIVGTGPDETVLEFAKADRKRQTNRREWNSTGLTWQTDDVVNLRLVVVERDKEQKPGEVEVWSGLLTASDLGGGWRGCHNPKSSAKDKCTTVTTLSDDDFTYDSVAYEITSLFVRTTGGGKGSLSFRINKDLTAAGENLVLIVGAGQDETLLELANADRTKQTKRRDWNNTGLTWETSDVVDLRLVTFPTTDICDRTDQVEDAIMDAIGGIVDCSAVRLRDLAGIEFLHVVDFGRPGSGLGAVGRPDIASGDFDDLPGMVHLSILNSPYLRRIPSDAFAGAPALVGLDLRANNINTLRPKAFSGLSNLATLELGINHIHDLPAGLFADLSNLRTLHLHANDLSIIDDGYFAGLSSLTELELQDNGIERIRCERVQRRP